MRIIRALSKHTLAKYPEIRGAALTIGNFESVHLGHLKLIGSLETQTPTAKVLISFEPSPNRYFLKTQQRIYGIKQKLVLLSPHVDFLVLLRFNAARANQEALDFLMEINDSLKPSHISIGDDFRFGKGRVGNAEMIEAFCEKNSMSFFQLHTIQDSEGGVKKPSRFSTSLVRENLKNHQLKKVQKILGRNYELTGKVRRGMQLARTIGAPTANIKLNFEPVITGVFAVFAHLPKLGIHQIKAVANLGVKPTIQSSKPNQFYLEVHFIEADLDARFASNPDLLKDLSGQQMSVEFVKFIRSEQKFAGIEALKAQIQKDIDTAKSILA